MKWMIPKVIVRQTLLWTAMVLPVCAGGPVIYETYTGDTYKSAGWNIAVNDLAFAKLNITTFDSYTKDQDESGGLRVTRERTTPSGDWSFLLKYTYDASGNIIRFVSDFYTFTGYDPKTGEGGLTRCLRVFNISSNGTMTLASEAMTDLPSGKKVHRTFFEPEIRHWMNVADLPKVTATWNSQTNSTTNAQPTAAASPPVDR